MKTKIAKIILWPKAPDVRPRIINFKMSGVEVITGKSQTGKSSLIAIVDYCLGSTKCAIPVGVIRNTVEWFGVLLKLPKTEILIARKNPGDRLETSSMYFSKGQNLTIPDSLTSMSLTSRDVVLEQINQLAGLPSLALTVSDDSGITGRPSFRDTAAFQFQPQHIIANPYTMYFKADTFEHQEKLKQIFPLVIGAVDLESMEIRRQLNALESELRAKQGLLKEYEQRGAAWLEDFKAFFLQAQEFGLLPQAFEPNDEWTIESYVASLIPVIKRVDLNLFPSIEPGASKRLAREISLLQAMEESTAQNIDDRKRKLTRIMRLQNSSDGYSKALQIQGDRLQPISWLADRLKGSNKCPICNSLSESATAEIRGLERLANEVSNSVGSIDVVNTVLDREATELSEELRKLESTANGIRERLSKLEQNVEQFSRQRQTLKDIYSFGGRLSQELKKYSEINRGDSVRQQVKTLEAQISNLRSKLSQKGNETAFQNALEKIASCIRYYAEILGVEHYERKVELDIKNLTIRIDGLNGRRDYLWEIGSASNHMGYHLATLLSLHEHFLNLPESACRPVPQYLIIDQPSQAFFPERWANSDGRNSDNDPKLDLDDTLRVQRIFKALSAAITRTESKLQIILIEHVGEGDWTGIPDIHTVERWRGDSALIPAGWIK